MPTLHKYAFEYASANLDVTEHPDYSEDNPDKACGDIEWLRENVYTLAFECLRDKGATLEVARSVARDVTNEMYLPEGE